MDIANILNTFDPMAAHLFDHFGLGIHPEDLLRTERIAPHPRGMLPTGYNRSWALIPNRSSAASSTDEVKSKMTTSKDGTFQVCVDVHHFKPKEIHVSTVLNEIVIEGKHLERQDDHGLVERRFVRKYKVPETYKMEDVTSNLSSDGVLTIKVPPQMDALEQGHRIIPVHHTGPAHLSIKEHGPAKETNGEKK
jgi:HSP20 family molecular chaperone IbpA